MFQQQTGYNTGVSEQDMANYIGNQRAQAMMQRIRQNYKPPAPGEGVRDNMSAATVDQLNELNRQAQQYNQLGQPIPERDLARSAFLRNDNANREFALMPGGANMQRRFGGAGGLQPRDQYQAHEGFDMRDPAVRQRLFEQGTPSHTVKSSGPSLLNQNDGRNVEVRLVDTPYGQLAVTDEGKFTSRMTPSERAEWAAERRKINPILAAENRARRAAEKEAVQQRRARVIGAGTAATNPNGQAFVAPKKDNYSAMEQEEAAANTEALEQKAPFIKAVGITSETPAWEAGRMIRNREGLTGADLREWAAYHHEMNRKTNNGYTDAAGDTLWTGRIPAFMNEFADAINSTEDEKKIMEFYREFQRQYDKAVKDEMNKRGSHHNNSWDYYGAM